MFFTVAMGIVTALTATAVVYAIPPAIGALAGVNLATMLLYGYDKAVAGGSKLRVPERVLHVLALVGGSPAALLSQQLFRHKSVKPSFRRVFWLIVVLQLAAIGGAVYWWSSRR
jgi:uncharacterized membrane protein YsdA (DUF1294 family)